MVARRNIEPKNIISHYTDGTGKVIDKTKYDDLYKKWNEQDKVLKQKRIEILNEINEKKETLKKVTDKYEVDLLLEQKYFNVNTNKKANETIDISNYPQNLKEDIREVAKSIQYLFDSKSEGKPTQVSLAEIIDYQWITRCAEINQKKRVDDYLDEKAYFEVIVKAIPLLKNNYVAIKLYKQIKK